MRERRMVGMGKGRWRGTQVNSQSEGMRELCLPFLVARIWGIISTLSVTLPQSSAR